jgi:hypothetical protein
VEREKRGTLLIKINYQTMMPPNVIKFPRSSLVAANSFWEDIYMMWWGGSTTQSRRKVYAVKRQGAEKEKKQGYILVPP